MREEKRRGEREREGSKNFSFLLSWYKRKSLLFSLDFDK
jgi:hypothetical protein